MAKVMDLKKIEQIVIWDGGTSTLKILSCFFFFFFCCGLLIFLSLSHNPERRKTVLALDKKNV
jgi:hypothetical protein